MKLGQKITKSNFFIRLGSWEFWPFGIIQFPAIVYWLWLSLRSKSMVFFSASNPGIRMGGMFGESKYAVLKNIPNTIVPKTILIALPTTSREVETRIREECMVLPLIFKPDIGERGLMVRKIESTDDMDDYLHEIKIDFLIQEWIDLPLEFGVFYTRYPGEKKGKVTSVVIKEMLSVTGDGKSTLESLIFDNNRAKLQWSILQRTYHEQLSLVIPAGEKMELVSIGNHALGTKFLNGNHLINDRLNDTFNVISNSIPGFYFGRFDLRCATLNDLYDGAIRVMELNGCGAVPTHIYDPDFSFWRGMWELIVHWRNIFEIARANKKLGVDYITFKEAWGLYRKFKAVTK